MSGISFSSAVCDYIGNWYPNTLSAPSDVTVPWYIHNDALTFEPYIFLKLNFHGIWQGTRKWSVQNFMEIKKMEIDFELIWI